ncbi:MAG: hypothetical protein RAP41_08725, partial [Candidatus Orphnella occulta]|nr:hypothetical protein [Candidatus Orphnella occulta]
VDPDFIAAIILTEQMDMRNLDIDKILPLIGWDSSRGPGQITERALRKHCAKKRWPSYDNKLTEELTDPQIKKILNGEKENIDNHILAIARIVKGIEGSIANSEVDLSYGNITEQKELQIGQAYTSDSRGHVPAPKEGMFTWKQLKDSELKRTRLYAYYVLINKKVIERSRVKSNYKYTPEEISTIPLIDSEKEAPAKSSSSGTKPAKVSANGKRILLSDSTKDLEAVAGETLVVAAFNQETGDRFMANLFPINQYVSLDKESDAWKSLYIETMLEPLSGPGWLAAVIRSGERYDKQSTHTRIDTHDITKYLKAQKIKFIVPDKRKLNKKIIFSAKGMISVKLPSERKATDIVDMWSGELLAQVKSSSAGKTVARPLDTMPTEDIKRILVVCDHGKALAAKLGETIIDTWSFITGLHRRYKDAIIYVSAPYNSFYLAGQFNNKIMPMPASVEDVTAWGYTFEDWVEYDSAGNPRMICTSQEMSSYGGSAVESKRRFIKEKEVDLIVETSVAPGRFERGFKQDADRPYILSCSSIISRAHALNSRIQKRDSALARYYDKQGNAFDVELSDDLKIMLDAGSFTEAGIWKVTMAFYQSLGLDMNEATLASMRLTPGEYKRAYMFLEKIRYKDQQMENNSNVQMKTIIVNVYAQTQEKLMGDTYQERVDTWTQYVSALIEGIENTHIIFTHGGEMDADINFVKDIVSSVRERTGSVMKKHRNDIILPQFSLYPIIFLMLGVVDGIVTLDTGMSHLANGVFNVPMLLITSDSIKHWATPRDNVHYIVRFSKDLESEFATVENMLANYNNEKQAEIRLRMRQRKADAFQRELEQIRIGAKKLTKMLKWHKIYSASLEEAKNDILTGRDFLSVGDIIAMLEEDDASDAIKWLLQNNRIVELESMINDYNNNLDVVLDNDVEDKMPFVIADYVRKKARNNATHLRKITQTPKASFGGIHVLSDELTANIGSGINRQIAPIYDPSSQVGLGRVTVVTSVHNFTKVDIDSLTDLAKCKTQAKYGDKKVNIILVYGKEEPYDKPKEALRACGFTDTGEYPTMQIAGDFSSLGKSEKDWVKISQEEQIAMIAASIRGQNRAVVTITNDIMARGIADVIPAYLNDRMKGKVVIASMQGATQATEINNDKIAENEIMFSPVLANAVREAELRFRNSADQQLFILKTLPPINSKEFEEFIQSLMDIKTAIEATASAA